MTSEHLICCSGSGRKRGAVLQRQLLQMCGHRGVWVTLFGEHLDILFFFLTSRFSIVTCASVSPCQGFSVSWSEAAESLHFAPPAGQQQRAARNRSGRQTEA